MAYASAVKSVTAEGSAPAAWVISSPASAGESSAAERERFGSGRERGAEDHGEGHNGDAADRSFCWSNELVRCSWMGLLHIDDFYPQRFLRNVDGKAGLGNRPGKPPVGNHRDVLRQTGRRAVVDRDFAREGFSRTLDPDLPVDIALRESKVIACDATCIAYADITAEENLVSNLFAWIAQGQIGKWNRKVVARSRRSCWERRRS
jgi:hypothetical protein